ncbi:MAG: esterase-like activity of phytase family protein [Leptolyngbyaceae bacterium]|nr:esterase-like activity of phytase family protein [Leptolyngbyaceae bacterium]
MNLPVSLGLIKFGRQFLGLVLLSVVLFSTLTACAIPRVTAEQRIFLDLSLDFLDAYPLPKLTYEGTPVGGLSAIAYDRTRDRFYALSDDGGEKTPARFYTLNLTVSPANSSKLGIQKVEVTGVTLLKQEDGNPYPKGAINPEGIALSPQQSVFVASEGNTGQGIQPFINEFDLQTGEWRQSLPLPKRYLTDATADTPQGVPNNLGFESLTIGSGSSPLEPFRVFAATEVPLLQDQDAADSSPPPLPANKNRFLHYLIQDGPPLLISEHLYPMDNGPQGSFNHGLTEMLSLDQGGHFLALERSFGLKGFGARIFQISTGGATDTAEIASLKGNVDGIAPIRKKLLLDLSQLNIPLDNLEGMTIGPRLPDGTQSLLLVSDDNFNPKQTTQFLLFRLNVKS